MVGVKLPKIAESEDGQVDWRDEGREGVIAVRRGLVIEAGRGDGAQSKDEITSRARGGRDDGVASKYNVPSPSFQGTPSREQVQYIVRTATNHRGRSVAPPPTFVDGVRLAFPKAQAGDGEQEPRSRSIGRCDPCRLLGWGLWSWGKQRGRLPHRQPAGC